MAKLSKQIQQLFLRLLNFTPELVDRTQKEVKLQNTSFDALVRAAAEKYLEDMRAVREQQREAGQEQEAKEYAAALLKAHFAEDRNEFLTADNIRSWYK